MEPATQVGQPSECGVVDTAGAWVSTWSAQIPLLMEFFIRDRRRSNCYKEEQRDICRVEQPPERSINDTAGAWVFTRGTQISVVDGVSRRTAEIRRSATNGATLSIANHPQLEY
nr:hypothetical protein Itr_chr01CG14640 [Ipomoea trifida]